MSKEDDIVHCTFSIDNDINEHNDILLFGGGCFFFSPGRHYRYEQRLACVLWKIDFRDIHEIIYEPTRKQDDKDKPNGTINHIQVILHGLHSCRPKSKEYQYQKNDSRSQVHSQKLRRHLCVHFHRSIRDTKAAHLWSNCTQSSCSSFTSSYHVIILLVQYFLN